MYFKVKIDGELRNISFKKQGPQESLEPELSYSAPGYR